MQPGKLIGIGNTAKVYEWEEGKVLKLFHEGYPQEYIVNEYHNARIIGPMNFEKPEAYEVITYEECTGIIYDKLAGESLLDWVMKTGNLQGCAEYMASLHKAIITNVATDLPDYKDFLKHHIRNAKLALDHQQEVMKRIDQLSDADTLCHGDFHPGNILLSEDKVSVIDFMNLCHGHYLYDIARTVFLVEYTPIPEDAQDKDLLWYFKKTVSELYLQQMGVTKEMIQEYLDIIILARKGECPEE
ncbi:MAG: aminoglycoside phosphotransferase family protein [Mobilitalea sp.]